MTSQTKADQRDQPSDRDVGDQSVVVMPSHGSVGLWRSFDDEIPEDGTTVLVCGQSIMQMVLVKKKDDGIGFYEIVHEPFLGYLHEGFVDRWAYIQLPDGEGRY